MKKWRLILVIVFFTLGLIGIGINMGIIPVEDFNRDEGIGQWLMPATMTCICIAMYLNFHELRKRRRSN